MKVKQITYKLKGKKKTIKNVIYNDKKEANYYMLCFLAQRSLNKK